MSLHHVFLPGETERTLLVLHGTGGDENSLISLGEALLPGANILSPRGNVSENGMPRFFRRFAEGVFDYEDIRLRAKELADFVASTAGEYEFDPAKVDAMGYSNGANIAWSTLLLRPSTLQRLVLFRPMVTLTDVEADLTGKKIFVSAGERDPIVPTQNVEQLVEQMKSLGAEVAVNWYFGGHELTHTEIELARDWLAG